MSQITIRGIDPQVEQQIRQIARETGKSLNLVILEMIYGYTGHAGQRKSPCASLAKLAGGWSKEEADDFFEAIKSCEQVDEELWQ